MLQNRSDFSKLDNADVPSGGRDGELVWARPTVKTLDVTNTTEGGVAGAGIGDDGWYNS